MQKIFSLLKPNIILCSRIPTQYYHHCNVKSLDNCLFLMLLFWNRYESFGILLLILILGCACDQDSILNTHKGRWSSYNNTRTRKSVSGCCNLVSVLYNWLLWNCCLVGTEWKCEIGVFLSIGRFDMWVSTRSFVLEMLEINYFEQFPRLLLWPTVRWVNSTAVSLRPLAACQRHHYPSQC